MYKYGDGNFVIITVMNETMLFSLENTTRKNASFYKIFQIEMIFTLLLFRNDGLQSVERRLYPRILFS
jgi:hypothetical protein